MLNKKENNTMNRLISDARPSKRISEIGFFTII
nr:MAG TPA: hypothetical protein [Caudoviricetes sp.]